MEFTGYWLTTPVADENAGKIFIISWNGKIYNAYCGITYTMSYRPIIRLPSDILEEKKEQLSVGSIVKYSPSGTYEWNAEYATSYEKTSSDFENANQTLSSEEGGDYRITDWCVLNLDKDTGRVDLVPRTLVDKKVEIQGAQGYNNAVYLLNEACKSLYSDTSRGILARSINIEDIENVFRESGNENVIIQPTKPYEGMYDSNNSKYPVIYGEENLSAVNSSGSLGLSEQIRLIERSEGSSTDLYIGAITSLNNMTKAYRTYYYKTGDDFINALGSKRFELIPNASDTSYWVASRCISCYENSCQFNINIIKYNYSYKMLYADSIFSSKGNDISGKSTDRIFPIISLNINQIEYEGTESGTKIFKIE